MRSNLTHFDCVDQVRTLIEKRKQYYHKYPEKYISDKKRLDNLFFSLEYLITAPHGLFYYDKWRLVEGMIVNQLKIDSEISVIQIPITFGEIHSNHISQLPNLYMDKNLIINHLKKAS